MLGIYRGHASDRDEAIVRETAERCTAAFLSEFGSVAQQMSAAELRGYVRAHAWPWISAESQRLISTGELPQARVNNFLSRTLEDVVHRVVRAYAVAPVVATPTPHIGIRKAA
jgi:hypothetical protein